MSRKKSKAKAKDRLDQYYELAKQQGYRARSAFKLLQLHRKYEFLANAHTLVDLCAAPGGWLQVAAKYMPITSKIVGVDLDPIRPIPGCKCLTGDIYHDRTLKNITNYLKGAQADIVLHDGAPNVGGVWSKESFAQNQLVLQACKVATQLLSPGGWFVTKVFRGEDFNKVLWVLKQFFGKVETTKPLASRMESAEVFVVCHEYKAPRKIDPRFFKVGEVFRETTETDSGAAIASKSVSKVPQGFEKMGPQFTAATITQFLRTEDPKEFLHSVSEIRFDPTLENETEYKRSTCSIKELLYLCTDLRQVSNADQKRLLRWREKLLKLNLHKDSVESVPNSDGGLTD